MEGHALILSLQTDPNDFAVQMKSPILSPRFQSAPHLSNLESAMLNKGVTGGNCKSSSVEMTSDAGGGGRSQPPIPPSLQSSSQSQLIETLFSLNIFDHNTMQINFHELRAEADL